jgi:hypothetical protein
MRTASGIFISVLVVAACLLRAATLNEGFATDPLGRGWRTFGDATLFHWNPTNQNLEVTWDSSRTNSYFQLPLGTILSKSDDFSLAFDLRLRDIAVGVNPGKPDTFEIAIGFLNSVNSTNTNYFRGMGVSSAYGVRNTIEFDYFPATAVISATFAPTAISSNNQVKFSDNHPLVMTTNDLFHIAMSYTASNQLLRTTVTRNGAPYGLSPSNTIKDLSLAGHPDFRVDRLAVMNYSDALQIGPTQFWGSVLAHGTVDNFAVTVPDPPVANFTGTKSNAVWRGAFVSRTNWFYSLERTVDFNSWAVASPTNTGTGGAMQLLDTNGPAGGAFYRIKASKP